MTIKKPPIKGANRIATILRENNMKNTSSSADYTAPSTTLQVISRKEALLLKRKRYFTGEPCKYGHIDERYLSDGRCAECCRIKLRKKYKNDPDKARQRVKNYRVNNPEKVKLWNKAYRDNNPELVRAWDKEKYNRMKNDPVKWDAEKKRQNSKQKKAYWKDPEKYKKKSRLYRSIPEVRARSNALAKKYKKNNPDVIRRLNQKHAGIYRAVKLKRIPNWLTSQDKNEIREIYLMSSKMREIGVDCHVDHIIPLQGKTVSGLHVPSNLQILTATENHSKGNRYHD